MTKRGKTVRARFMERATKVGQYQFNLTTFAISGALLLIIGIGIGGSTQLWNSSLKVLGFKPNVPDLDFSSLEATYEQVAANYDGTIDKSKLLDGAQHGLVSALGDPYTVYFNADEAKSFSDELSGSFSGIGAGLSLKDSVITVSSVLKGSPAEAAGVKVGDQIIQVNGASTEGWSIDKTATTVRGKAGTTVKLVVVRDGADVTITATRADLTNPSVTSEIKDGIGIMTISRFGDDTTNLARQAAGSFKQANVKGVILDLRGNGGGEVDAAQNIASLWLDNKVVMTARTGGVTTQTLRSASDPVLGGIPTIVLIDGGSASASEIVSAALHDNKAATLYGQQSFGKGSEQSVLSFPGGSELKVTVAHWYTPAGINITKTGITPDVKITPTDDEIQAGADPVKDAALAKLGQ